MSAVPGEGAENESRVRVRTRQVVTVDVLDDGTPSAVRAQQRLFVRGVGDYVFAVAAPVRDVSKAAGSESTPGLRTGQILWQGFSPGHKLLAANAVLDLRAAATLPLTVRISMLVAARPLGPGGPQTGRLQLRVAIRNRTLVTAPGFGGDDVSALDVARALDRLRRAIALGQPLPEQAVRLGRTKPLTVAVSAPLRVSGSIAFDAASLRVRHISGASISTRGGRSTLRFERVLGGARPLASSVAVDADAVGVRRPTIRLLAEPVLRDAALSPPGRSWTDAELANRLRLGAAALLRRAIVSGLRYARARQFETFLATPDPVSPSRTTYVFRSVTRAHAATAAPINVGGGGVPAFVVVLAAIATAIGLVVLWAHM